MTDTIMDQVGGLNVVIKSHKIDIYVYKELSGKVIIQATKKEREEKGVVVFIRNYYFGQLPSPDPSSVQPVLIKVSEKETQNAKRTVLREFAVGIGVKLKGNTVLPTQVSVELPIAGVRTEARITINGQTKEFITTAGAV